MIAHLVATQIQDLPLVGLRLIEPAVHADSRGYFFELHHQARFEQMGLADALVQDNVSRSRHGVLRGLHFQAPGWQGKLVSVLQGEIFDVAVDLRRHSPSFGQWHGVTLSEENHRQLWVPPGFAHGFCVTSEVADVVYKCTDYYDPSAESGISFKDPDIGIEWPDLELSPSDRDAGAPILKDVEGELPFVFGS